MQEKNVGEESEDEKKNMAKNILQRGTGKENRKIEKEIKKRINNREMNLLTQNERRKQEVGVKREDKKDEG